LESRLHDRQKELRESGLIFIAHYIEYGGIVIDIEPYAKLRNAWIYRGLARYVATRYRSEDIEELGK
jgi:hypothetical protein